LAYFNRLLPTDLGWQQLKFKAVNTRLDFIGIPGPLEDRMLVTVAVVAKFCCSDIF
jgi:hypothetical protein